MFLSYSIAVISINGFSISVPIKIISESDFDKLIGEITDLKPNQFDLIHEVLVK